jgi:hypothetical protein
VYKRQQLRSSRRKRTPLKASSTSITKTSHYFVDSFLIAARFVPAASQV